MSSAARVHTFQADHEPQRQTNSTSSDRDGRYASRYERRMGAIPGKTADGIVHDVPRYTMHGSMSYLSRLANPMTDTARSKREPHHMHGTQWE
jgi:hypothetical protein